MNNKYIVKNNNFYIFVWLIACFIALMGIMVLVSPLKAATLTPSEVKYNKTWKIKLSQPVNPDSVNSNSVYVLNENDQEVPNINLQVKDNEITVSLTDDHTYAEGTYRLVVTDNLTAKNTGKKLNQDVVKPFEVLGRNCFTFDDGKLPTAILNFGYSTNLGARTDKTIKTIWKALDTLPQGLTLDSDNGVLYGKPLKIGEYSFRIRKTTPVGKNEDKLLRLLVLPDKFDSYVLTPPKANPGEQTPLGQATLYYPDKIQKQIEIIWDTPIVDQFGIQKFTSGILGATNFKVNISYLREVDFNYNYWSVARFEWRTVIVKVDPAVREVWMDAEYKNPLKTRKMDFMPDLANTLDCNVFGINTNSLEVGKAAVFHLYDAYGQLLETREMVVQE